MNKYTLIVNGRITETEGYSAEGIARGEMCWWSCGTVATVLDENGKAEVFKKILTDNKVTGYCDLIKISA